MKMRMRSHIGRLVPAAVAAGLLFLAGCGGGNTSTTPVPPTPTPSATGPIMIFPGTVSVPVGGEAQFSAFLASDPTAAFTWSVSSGGGTIDSASGLYTAPTMIPSPATVTITAKGSSTSGTALVTIVAAPAGGVAITPAAVVVPAGAPFKFSATANGNPVTPTWQVAGITGGDSIHGSHRSQRQFHGAAHASSGRLDHRHGAERRQFGDRDGGCRVSRTRRSSGQYAFSYSGEDSKGPLMVAGSFTADSSTASITGIEDYNSTAQAPVTASPVSGSYSVNPDGTATATLTDAAAGGSATWNLTLVASTQGQASPRALLVRFDKTATGSGEADVQDKTKFAVGIVQPELCLQSFGPRQEQQAAADHGHASCGGVGIIVLNLCKDDINDAGTTTEATADTSLHGLFGNDTANPSTLATNGRGTLQLIYGATAGIAAFDKVTLTFAFYIVDSTHLKLVETDANTIAQLAGDLFSAPNTDGAFSTKILNGNYAFTLSGSNPSGTKAYALGGVFKTNGSGSISTGVIDGGLGNDVTLTTSSYTVDTSLGRILFTTTIGSTTRYFAGYATSSGTVEMIELDTDLQASGTAYPQTSTGIPQGSFAFNLKSNANTSAFDEEDVIGQIAVPNGTLVPLGSIDVNDKGTLTSGTPIESTSAIVAPDINGRGTLTLDAKPASYSLAYYVLDNTTALAIEIDGQRVATGIVARQF